MYLVGCIGFCNLSENGQRHFLRMIGFMFVFLVHEKLTMKNILSRQEVVVQFRLANQAKFSFADHKQIRAK